MIDSYTCMKHPTITKCTFVSQGGSHSFICTSEDVQVMGNNDYGQLGIGDTMSRPIPVKNELVLCKKQNQIDWGYFVGSGIAADEIQLLRRVEQLSRADDSNIQLEDNWHEIQDKVNRMETWMEQRMNTLSTRASNLTQEREAMLQEMHALMERYKSLKEELSNTENKTTKVKKSLAITKMNRAAFTALSKFIGKKREQEEELESQFIALFENKKFTDFGPEDISVVLWRIGLLMYQDVLIDANVTGEVLVMADKDFFVSLGISTKDSLWLIYHIQMMTTPKYIDTIKSATDECVVCWHTNPRKTVDLINEYEIPLDNDAIVAGGWTAPHFLFFGLSDISEEFNIESLADRVRIIKQFAAWKEIHNSHLLAMS